MQDFIGVEMISCSECRVLVGPFPSMKEHSEAIRKVTRLETFFSRPRGRVGLAAPKKISILIWRSAARRNSIDSWLWNME